MKALDLTQVQRVHIVGIGGAGMSAIARVLHGHGVSVQGSDRRASPLTAALQAEGMAVAIGHDAANVGDVDLVLASSAVPEDNVELVAARARGIAVVRRPHFLGPLTEGYEVIAVAGAHGKTTVSGMLAWLLLQAELDPTFIVGGVMANTQTNARAGSGPHFVIEADEYRKTFLALRPSIAVVTNVEFDHPDCFPSPRFVRLAFGEFVERIMPEGLLVACNDDEVAHAIAASHHARGGRLALYGIAEGEGLAWRATDLRTNAQGGVSFTALRWGMPQGEIALALPGVFNVLNALAVLTVAEEVGIAWPVARAALESFAGTARRFEVLGEAAGVVVIDDYAHHPTQIQGVLHAARQRYAGRRLVAAWEPHTFSRVRALHEEFMTAFAEADEVVILPIYAAREVDDGTLSAVDLAGQVAHPQVSATNALDEAVSHLAEVARPGDVVLMMGAGNEYLVGQRLLAALAVGMPFRANKEEG